MPSPQFQRRAEIRETDVSLQTVDLGRASSLVTETADLAAGGTDAFTVTPPTGETWELCGIRVTADNVDTDANPALAIYDDTTDYEWFSWASGVVNKSLDAHINDGDVVVGDSRPVRIEVSNDGTAAWTSAREYFVLARRYV